MARYEFVEGTSSKFWEILLEGPTFTVRYGRIGTDGQTQVKSFASAAVAQAEHDKLVKEKTKKGYALAGAAPASPAPAAPAPALPPPPAPPAAAAPAPRAEVQPLPTGDGWLDAGNGYALTLRDGRIVARNAKGKELASVPKDLREGETWLSLSEALELLETHEAECREAVELWMLRSLPVPKDVLLAVWPDPSWRGILENAVITPGDGPPTDGAEGGLLRGVDPVKGLGVVTLDGDTRWLGGETVRIPHPMLLPELDDYRSLLAEANLEQRLAQLFRETFARPSHKDDDQTVEDWSGAEFDLLAVAISEARKGGWRVRGGAASCATWEDGHIVEARYDLGEGDPTEETTTGSLYWVDAEGSTLPLGKVGPVAWSEGMRMAATIHKKRKVEEEKDGADA